MLRDYASRMQQRGLLPASILVLAVLTAMPMPLAHHSVSGQFDESKSVTLKGTISKVDWINPHPYVYLDVKGVNGKVRTWALSMAPIPMLRKAGLTKEKLAGKPGELVTIVANPARNGKDLGWISRITYSDGHFYE